MLADYVLLIHQLVNENMASAARVHAIERGKDPRRYPLFAFGGAGPVHAFGVASILHAPGLIVPTGAGVASTIGFLVAPLAFDFVRSAITRLDRLDWDEANRMLDEMEREGRGLLASAGVPADEVRVLRSTELRYVGQGHDIAVPVPDGELSDASLPSIQETFEELYRHFYQRTAPGNPIETVGWRVVVTGPKPDLPSLRLSGDREGTAAGALKGQRDVYDPSLGSFKSTPVYDRYLLQPGDQFAGPAIIEERESTVVIGAGNKARIDESRNLIVDIDRD